MNNRASELAESLIMSAVRKSAEDLPLAQHQLQQARKIMLRFNVRFDYSLRRFICHGCKRLVVPGANARVRVSSNPKSVNITCLNCGRVNRKTLRHP
jgi:RNase P subunit RPR2